MTRRTVVRHYILALAAFLVLDAVWLGWLAGPFYRSQLGFWLAESPRWWAAGVFYLLFITGLMVFVIVPGAREGSLGRAVAKGGLFGLVTYAAYDLTNQATVEGWPVVVTVVDLVWGTALSATTSFVSLWLGKDRTEPRSG